ncbi:MAG: hypothetical protein WCK78_16555 [Paludibacter sp.]
MNDFTLHTYRQLLQALKNAGYLFLTFEEWCESNKPDKFVILRHDIDNKPQNALTFARIENELGIKASYFFRTSNKILIPEIIKTIQLLGHEIGYHYRDLVDASGNIEKAIKLFETNLSKFRSIAKIKTISMDGCPWSKFDNRELWNDFNYHDFGIIGEPYFDFLKLDNVHYFTDTGRMWNGDKYNIRDKVDNHLKQQINDKSTSYSKIHNTFDFVKWLKSGKIPDIIMINTHPQRWTDNKIEWFIEFIGQNTKNIIKHFITSFRE